MNDSEIIDSTGFVQGMKQLGYWDKKAQVVRSHGCLYNIDKLVIDDELDRTAHQYCRCGVPYCGY